IGTSQEYRSKFDSEVAAHAADNSAKDLEIGDLKGQLDELTRQNQSKADQIKQKDASQAALSSDLETERQQNADMREDLGSIDSKLGDLEQNNQAMANRAAELERDNQSLRSERDDALDARDAATAAETAADERARSAEGVSSDLRLQLARSVDRAESAEANLAAVARKYNLDINKIGGQPDMDGVVLSASYDDNPAIVMINLGSSNKVRPGFTFDVYNGAKYKGRIRVEVVNSNNSSCTVDLPGDAQIGAGDRISTNL
ncbi:MAG: hypothetical protein MK213_03035, partial [Planctomycetes bacterium]|nr:hypothetical protein [Planctomycetota bacterium]